MRSAALVLLLTSGVAAPALGQQSTMEEFKLYCLALRGRWVSENPVTAHADVKIVADGNAVFGTLYMGDEIIQAFTAYDAHSKQIFQTLVFSAGVVQRSIVYRKNDTWVFDVTGSVPDGKKIEGQHVLTISDGGKTHRYTGTMNIGGTAADDIDVVWRRVFDE